MNYHLNICLLKEANWYETVYLCVFYSFLISLPLPLSIIKGRNAPGKPMREVSETWAHSHGFCLCHPAFCVWPLCNNCVCARACVYYTFCHHLKMGVASPLTAHEELSSNVHCRCHFHDNSKGWGNRSLSNMAILSSPEDGTLKPYLFIFDAIYNTNRIFKISFTVNMIDES